MKKAAWTVMIVLALGGTACKRPGDVLATYKDGKVTRAEFYQWMEMKHISKETTLKSKQQQKGRLETMVLERLAAADARKEKLDQTTDFAVLRDMAADAQLMEFLYDKEIRKKTSLDVPAVKVQHIMLRVRGYTIRHNRQEKLSGEELLRETHQVMAKARGLIARLRKGEEFDKLAAQYSEDFSRRKGGDAGYIVDGMMPKEYTDAAFALNKGDYTKEPVLVRNSVYIIRVNKKKNLTNRNIEKVLGDKMKATRVRNHFYNEAAHSFVKKLSDEKDVVSNIDNAITGNKNLVLFAIGDKRFTVADFEKRIDFYQERHRGLRRNSVTRDQKILLARNFFRIELLKREAVRRGLDRDPDFLKRVALRTDGLLAREYFNKMKVRPVHTTPQEIREEYERNREQRYYRIDTKGKEKVKVVEPLVRVQERIRKMLESKKHADHIREVRDSMLKGNNVIINQSELEGK